MMERRYQYQLFVVVLIAAFGALTGCQLASPPSASISPQIATVSFDSSTLRSAHLRYETHEPAADAASDAELTAVDAARTTLASFDPSSDAGVSRLLAIRYPHPDGRLDVARVELVIGNARDDLPAQTASWHRRITELFGELTPGVAWGTGIQQAKTLDIKRSELQEMLAQLENSASAPVQPASAFTESSVKPDPHRSVENTLLHIEVNGETTVLDGMRPAQLEALVRHVLHRGKLMTIRSTASELFGDRRANPAIRRAVALAPAGLSPLPRVDGAAPMPRIHGSETTP